MSSLVDAITGLPVWLLLVTVFVVPASEAALFFGLFLPGETVVLLGGVAAHSGTVALWSVIVVAILGAIIGDEIGFLVGRRYGRGLVLRLPGVAQRSGGVDRGLAMVQRRGALAVFLGRWTAALRALVPGLAGMSGMSQVRFSTANVLGGALWAGTIAVAGYLAGASYQALADKLGLAGEVMAGVVVVALLVWLVVRHLRHPRGDNGPVTEPPLEATTGHDAT